MRRWLSTAYVLLLIVLAAFTVGIQTTTAATPPALDGSAKGGCGYVTTCSVSLSTIQSPDVIIVGCDCWPNTASFSVQDTAGLVYHQITGPVSIGGNQIIQEWYAIATTPLSQDQVSVETALTGETWYGVIAFAVSGANTVSPFDSNPSLPRAQANTACPGNYPCNTGVSTSGPDFVYQFGGDTGYALETPGSGFTLIGDNTGGGDAYAQFMISTAPLSSATLSFGTAQGWDFGVIADAIQPATSGSSSTSSSSSTTSTPGAPPSLDGSANNGCGYVMSCSAVLSTSHASDVIIVGCDCWPQGGSFSVRDSAGLTFSQRTPQMSIGGNQFVQTWYAVASAPLTQDVISVVTTLTGETWYGVVVFAVSGANTQSPFDPNPSLPRQQANIACAGGFPCNTMVSTTLADDFVFQLGGDTGSVTQSAGSGLTLIQQNKAAQNIYSQYETASTRISGATLSFGISQGNDFGVIADAIQAAPIVTTSTTSTSSTTSTTKSSTSSSSTSSSTSMTSSTSTSTTTSGGSNDWPSFTLDYADSRYQANSAITSSTVATLSAQWSITTAGSVTSTPVVLNGNVYFADWAGNVYSASVATGHINWQTNLGYAISSTLALANGLVYVGLGPNGPTEVVALSQTTGSLVWSTTLKATENAIWASPIVYNGLVYIGVASSGDESNASWIGEMFALNANSGTVVWTWNATTSAAGGAGIWGSVVVDPSLNSIYFGTGNPYGSGSGPTILYSYSVISLDASTGSLNWYHPVYTSTTAGGDLDFGSTPNLFTVTISGTTYDAIGLGSKGGTYYVLDRTNGNLLGSAVIDSSGDGQGIIGVPGYTYLGSNNPEIFVPSQYGNSGTLGAYTPATGALQWSFNTPGVLVGSVAVVPGAVLFGDEDGNLYAFSNSGTRLFTQTFPSGIYGGVTVAENYLFVPTAFGTTNGVYAFTPVNTSLKLDSSGSCSNGLSPECTIKLTATSTNDLIYVQESSQSGHSTAQPTDTAGLVYSLRASKFSSDTNEYTSVWTAVWSGSGTDTVTCNGDNGDARIGCVAVAISGVNLSSPFDNNPAVPCSGTSTSSTPSCALSTNHADVMILGSLSSTCGVTPVAGSGFAVIQSFTTCNANSALEYKLVPSTEVNLSVTFALSSSTGWVIIGDAVVGST